MSKLITIVDFAEKYGTSSDNIYSSKHIGKLPESIFVKASRNHTFIDESFFTRRVDFRKKIWLKAHDNFYFLTKHISVYKLAQILNKMDMSRSADCWSVFLNGNLFGTLPISITIYKTPELLWKFYRYSRWLIRGLFIRLGRFVPDRQKIVSSVLDNY